MVICIEENTEGERSSPGQIRIKATLMSKE